MILTFLHLAIFRILLFSIGKSVPPPSYVRNAYCEAHYVAQKLNSSKNMFPVFYTTKHLVFYREMPLQESVEMLASRLRTCSSLPGIFVIMLILDTVLQYSKEEALPFPRK
jgi:hypothetical protein